MSLTGEVSLKVSYFSKENGKFELVVLYPSTLFGLCRVILVVGFLIFLMVVLYVVSKRIGVLTLQRKIVAAIKSGSIPNKDAIGNAVLNQGIAAPLVNDEL